MAKRLASLIGLAMLSGALALRQGQDGNWDLLNYHLYNSFAWLEGRYDVDHMPAQLQTWYNPLLDLPFYWLATAPVSGIWPTLWLALPAGVALWLCLRLLESVAPAEPSTIARAACLLIAAGGAAGYPSLGTTFNEWPIAAAVLAALLLVIRELSGASSRASHLALAGFIAGAAFGLKYTAAFNCLALAVLSVVAAPRGRRLPSLVSLAAGGVAGALLTAGYWTFAVYARTGNPIFPHLNNVFASPAASSALHYPYSIAPAVGDDWSPWTAAWLLAAGGRTFSEIYVRDPRLLAGFLLTAGLLPVLLVRRRSESLEHDRRLTALLVFFLASLSLWRLLFPTYRFAIVLECIVAVALVGGLLRLTHRGLRTAILVALVAVLFLGTDRPNWRRVPFKTPFIANHHPELPDGSAIVILTGEPLAYATVGLPARIPVYSLFNNLIGPDRCTAWLDEALERVSEAPHIWALQQLAAASALELANGRRFGFAPPGGCRRIRSTLGDTWLCSLKIDRPLACGR